MKLDVKELLLTQTAISLVNKHAVSLLRQTNTGGRSEKRAVTLKS
jgi:hypothetical protein